VVVVAESVVLVVVLSEVLSVSVSVVEMRMRCSRYAKFTESRIMPVQTSRYMSKLRRIWEVS